MKPKPKPHPRHGRKRKWFKVAAILLAPTLFLGGEVVLRLLYGEALFYERHQPGYILDRFTVIDRELFRRARPGIQTDWSVLIPTLAGAIRINSHGLRGPEIEARKAKDTFRIACLGDSCVFGWGMREEDVVTRVLERELGQRFPQRRFEVLNFGSPGYTTHQGAVQMRRDVPAFSPDVVVLAFGYNDFFLSSFTDEAQAAAYDQYFREHPPWQQTLHRVLSESAVYRYLRYLVGLPIHHDLRLQKEANPVWRVGPQRFREHLQAMVSRAAELGAETVLINSCVPNAQALRELRAVADSTQLPLLDLRAVYEPHAETGSLMLEDGVHPNARGHELWAEALLELLLRSPKLGAFVR